MNQEQKNMDSNSFNTQENNGMLNNQPLQNEQSFNNQSVNISEQSSTNYQQQINQTNIVQPLQQSSNNIFENAIQNQMPTQQYIHGDIKTNYSVEKNNIKKGKNLILYIIIAFIAVLLISTLIIMFVVNPKNNTKSVQYLSLNMTLSSDLDLEENYIEKKIYTFVYGEDEIIKRIIFTDTYYLENTAKSDYDLYLKNNNYDNDWNMPKKILKIKNNVLTYEYNSDIVEEYYDDFIGMPIDEIVNEYGKDKVLDDFKPNLTNKELLYLPQIVSDNQENTSESKVDFELIAHQAEQKLKESFTVNYNEAFNVNNQYYATVDKDSIRYTNEYSNGEYYYVMIGTVRNLSTNIIMGKYLIRCKWDSATNKIKDYGDNSKIIIITNLYEEAILKGTKSTGLFYIEKDQYKKDILWDTSKLDKSNFKNILNQLDKINYYNYEYSSVKSESYFNEMKAQQEEIIKKLLSVKEINIYTVQIVTSNELEIATSLATYINSNLYIANDDNFNNLLEYSKDIGLFSQKVLNTDN